MGDETQSAPNAAPEKPASSEPSPSVWSRVNDHKVIQWSVAYLGIALALAQGQELLAAAFDWPEAIARGLIVALIVGFPIAVTVAWYHGHRGLQKLSAGELAIVSVLLLIGAGFFAAAFRPAEPAAIVAAVVPPAAEASASPIQVTRPALSNKIAVLPCQNLSPNADDAYFASGLHDEIVWRLGSIRGVNVIPPRAVLRYADTVLSPREIAVELDARALLDCTVRYAEPLVRITARLVPATGDETLWDEQYERNVTDVFAVQADIATQIANALSVELSAEERSRLSRVQTSSPQAYALWLRARSADDLAEETALLERAIEADRDFAAPYAQLAWITANRYINDAAGSAVPLSERQRIERDVQTYADRAIALDRYSARAHAAKAVPAFLNWRWSEADAGFRLALESNQDPTSSQYYVYLLLFTGRQQEAMTLLDKAAQLDPDLPWRSVALGYTQQHERSLTELRSTLIRYPTLPTQLLFVAFKEVTRGDSEAAAEALELAEQLQGASPLLVFLPEWAYAYGRAGRPDAARRLFDALEERVAAGETPGFGGWASAYLAIGDERRALEALENAARRAQDHVHDEGFWSLMNLRMNVSDDPVLRKPEFAAVLQRIRGN
jgi:TolB-like protein